MKCAILKPACKQADKLSPMSSIAGRREALDSVAFRCLPFFIHRYKKNPLQVLMTNGFAFPQRKEKSPLVILPA